MLETLIIIGFIGIFYYIVYWSIRNDAADRIDEQTGLLGMQAPDGAEGAGEPEPSLHRRDRRRSGGRFAPRAGTRKSHGSQRRSRAKTVPARPRGGRA